MENNLVDSFGRIAKKLRISITDRCNMQCIYCMPSNNTKWLEQDNLLSYEQITRLAKIFVSLGIEKIKITGGEPTVRGNVENLIKSLSSIEGLRSISMTTNGILLKDKIKILKESGLESLNISLDTFKPDRFKSMSGIDGFYKVMDAINTALKENLPVKINTVIMRGWNDDEISQFVRFSRDTGCIVKFIEFMPLDGTGIWSEDLVVSKKKMIETINKDFDKLSPLHNDKSDPARLYTFEDGKGVVGFIPSITEPFCQNCDRMRLTADGKLYSCLFDKSSNDLKSLLEEGKSDIDIIKCINKSVQEKPEGIIKIIKTHSLRPTLNVMHTIGG
ncbi:GTP 3',8-cyclase MoaA [Candidatus Nitrosocosmicus arcticus]|uniref:GTP 3',8-cyclase n=1 Tax=Candidatus Nitrosocosmicus arcticus TaxID=2035267 RepID=A0A557SUZ7_9ARCH|nr:GTP 3',8-cyclase MoaA [Candidatus Nitrosocosmicus arcticus]TVP40427.1 GTP 3',8'-cyclase / Cyclic pyranopterin monophosphate synthase [Candidatus Nitrosocosmicus arcticus]